MTDPLYVAARQVLLDVFEDLTEQLNALVLVGAQAVYLQVGPSDFGVADFTTDADIALDADLLRGEPLLENALGERFRFAKTDDGDLQPGMWIRTVEVDSKSIDVPVDLLVPTGMAPTAGMRGARLGEHGNRAARKTVGLEAALIDNNVMSIGALEKEDDRVFEVRVAGPTALLIAKAHKIHDRIQLNESGSGRITNKDAGDVFRLMQTTQARAASETLTMLLGDERAAPAVSDGVSYLREQFGARRSPGVEMAIQAFGGSIPEERVVAVCVGFVKALRDR